MSDVEIDENEEQQPVVEEEEPIFEEEREPVAPEVIATGLSKIGKTAGGATYAFTCLNLENKHVQDLTDVLGAYKHLRDVNLNHNDIMDVSECQRLDYLVSLQASHNRIGSVRFFHEAGTSMQYLQNVDLSHNKVLELTAMPQPKLLQLNLDSNLIQTCEDFGGHAQLVRLSLNRNKLSSVVGICNMAQLQELSLGFNQLACLKEIANLPMLKKLDLNTNKIASLDQMPDLPALEHLDLSNNKLASQDCFPALHKYKCLQTLIMTGCPFVEELADRFKAEALIALGTDLHHLKMLGEEEVADEDVTAANDERAERIKQKKEAEEEAARLAAEKAEEEAAAAAAGEKPAEDE